MWMTWKFDPDALNSIPMRIPSEQVKEEKTSFLYPSCGRKSGNPAEKVK